MLNKANIQVAFVGVKQRLKSLFHTAFEHMSFNFSFRDFGLADPDLDSRQEGEKKFFYSPKSLNWFSGTACHSVGTSFFPADKAVEV